MSKAKKVLLMCTAYVLVAALAIGGTLAYLTSTDDDVNVMTLGNVSIAQHEYQRAEGVAHDAGDLGAGNGVKEGALVPFVQGKKLYPAVPANNASTDYSAEQDTENLFFWGDYVYSGTAGNGLWNDNKLSNVMDKMVFVENTGKSDAYFRTIIAFECPEGMEYSQGSDKEFMMNTNGSTVYAWEDIGYTTIDGVRYLVMVATYQNALKPGNQSHPSLLQVVMTHNATNEDVELLGDTYEILVLSQAVQTGGFADAETALDAAFGDITTTNHPWTQNVPVIPSAPFVSTAAELKAALESGNSVSLAKDLALDETFVIPAGKEVTIDLAGNELSYVSNEAKGSCAINNKGTLTIKNGTVTYKGVGDPNFGYGTNTITNSGKLIIDGTTIINTTDSGSSVAIDCSAGAELIVNSGEIISQKNAIRLCPFGSAAINCTINGGTITGARAIQIQLPSNKPSDAPDINLTVTGGKLTGTNGLALYSYSAGQSFTNVDVTITGGTFNGDVAFGGGAKDTQENVTINGGTFNGELGRYLANDGWEDIAKPQ